jgi:hypothetical protein
MATGISTQFPTIARKAVRHQEDPLGLAGCYRQIGAGDSSESNFLEQQQSSKILEGSNNSGSDYVV